MFERRLSHKPVASHIRTDALLVTEDARIRNVIYVVRKSNVSDQTAYLYVTDEDGRLVGILPIVKLLTSNPEQLVREVMIKRILCLKESDTFEKAWKLFGEHKCHDVPVLDEGNKFLGVFDVADVIENNLSNPKRNPVRW